MRGAIHPNPVNTPLFRRQYPPSGSSKYQSCTFSGNILKNGDFSSSDATTARPGADENCDCLDASAYFPPEN